MKVQRFQKDVQNLNFSQLRRLKMMGLSVMAGVCFTTLSTHMVAAKGELAFEQDAEETANFMGRSLSAIDVASDISVGSANGKFCQARFIPSRFEQTTLNKSIVGVSLFTILTYMFVGISVGTEYLLDAAAKIVSRASNVEVQDLDGKTMMVGVPKWSPSIINLTLMALCASLPETFLSLMSAATQSGFNTGIAAELGPLSLLGSTSFNLLVVLAISIATSAQLKTITRVNVFLVLAAFSALALVWLFVALVVITPGYITYVEAAVTISLFPMVLMFAWVTEKCSREAAEDAEELQASRIRVSRAHLKNIIEQRGAAYALELATGNLNEAEDRTEMEMTQECFKAALGTEDLSTVTLEELTQVIEDECTIDRLNHRVGTVASAQPLAKIMVRDFQGKVHQRKSSDKKQHTKTPKDKSKRKGKHARDFSLENVNESGRAFVQPNLDTPRDFGNVEEYRRNPVIGFKQRRFAVTEKITTVRLIIEKRIMDLDQTFWIETQDDTAIAGKDYEAFSQKITMKAEELEHEIEIKINGNSKFASNAQFKVVLCEEEVHTQLEGIDSTAIIMLVSEKDKTQLEGLDLTVAVSDQVCDKDGALTLAADSKSDRVEELERRRKIIATYLALRNPTYADQFKNACQVNADVGDNTFVDRASACETLFHVIATPWKLLFATTPSRSVADGWVAFVYSALLICGITFAAALLITDVGCFYNVKPVVQGLVIMALGTSIPQAMTSVRAASATRTRDANNVFSPVVATNAASIFMGLGAPWTIATVYRHVTTGQDLTMGKFETGHIAFAAVTLFAISILAFIVLGLRRWCVGAELGGGKMSRAISALVMITLWLAFVGVNVSNTYNNWEIFTPSMNHVAATQLDSEQVKLLKAVQNFNTAFECQVQLKWTPPPHSRSQIGRYRLQAQDQYKRFHFLSQLCGSSNDKMSCVIPMSTFTQPPLSLPNGAAIKVRASPFIGTRWGPNYEVNTEQAIVKSAPTSMSLPRVTEKTDNSVTLVWDIVQRENPNESYDCFQSKVSSSQWTKITDTSIKDRSIKIEGLEPNREYLFKICAKAVCGHVFSNVLRVKTKSKPVAPTLCGHCVRIDALADGCAVKFQWTAPHGAHALQPFLYRLNIRNSVGTFVQAPASCLDVQATTCRVTMEELRLLNLKEGSPVVAVVQACHKDTGSCEKRSQPSNENVKVLSPPARMGQPVHLNAGQANPQYISLSWDGQVMPLSWQDKPYELLMCTGQNCDNFAVKYETSAMTQAMRTNPAVNSYSFRVRQKNACGTSPDSEVLTINLQSVVNKLTLSAAKSQNGCSLQFKWNCGSQCDQIEAYRLTVQGNSGAYELPQCRRKNGASAVCDVQFEQFSSYPFYLTAGKQIVAQIQAKNAVGWSMPAQAPVILMEDTLCRRTTLKATAYDSDKIYLEWAPVAKQSQSQVRYSLFWDAGIKDGQMVPVTLPNDQQLKYTVEIEGNGKRNFHFQVKVECACGKTSTSNTLLVCVAAKPVPMSAVTVSSDCCSSRIQWQIPQSNPAVIQYNLVIQGLDGQFYRSGNNFGTKGTDTEAVVPNSVLVGLPYNLPPGHNIVAKIQALNPAGWGPFSPVNMASAGTSIQNVQPKTPTNIQEIQSDESSVTIQWSNTLGNDIQVEDMWYEVYANSGPQGSFVILPNKFGVNQYTATDLKPAQIYKFKVTARNCCGRSGFTKEFPITVFKKPTKPVLPCPVSSCDGQMKFTWAAPDTFNSAITAIEFIILDNNLKEHVYQPCSIIGKTTCLIFSRTLLQAPYNLADGSLVQAYIRMQNQGGWSAKSEDQTCKPQGSGLKVKPCMMASPQLVEDKNSEIKLKWNKCLGNKQDTRYVLKWDQGDESMKQEDYVSLTTTESNEYPARTHDFDSKRKFTFSIQSQNQLCGSSQPAVLKVVRTFAPSQMKCVTVRQQQCAAEFSWEAPQDNGGSDVTDYKIQVRKGDGTWYHLTDCNQCQFSGKCQCTIQMRFLSEQLGLKKGQEIIVRGSSRNKVGWSETSQQCQAVPIIGLPDKMEKPTLSKQHPSTISANWQQCSSSGCYYQLFWGVSGSQKNQLTITDKNTLEHKETGLSAGIPYEFCIRSWNVCGCNELSCNDATLAKRPSAVSITQLPSKRQPCTADFAWKPAEDNGAPVTAYEVQVASQQQQTGPTQWNDLTTCMTQIENQIKESENKGLVVDPSASFTCSVNMKDLAAAFNLKIGDDVYYRIRAKNLVGWGEYTPAMRNSQRMVTEPLAPIKPKIDNYSKNGFRVCWQAPPGLLSLARIRHDYKFFLHHNEGKNSIKIDDYSQVKGPTTDLCHIFNNLNRAELHNVYVSVQNECGRSPPHITNVPIAKQPSAPECSIRYKNCALEISWSKPETTKDAPVSGFKVSLGQAGSTEEVEYAGCSNIGPDSADSKCYVQMNQMADSGLYDWFKATNQIQIGVQGVNMHGAGAKCSSEALPIKSRPPRLGQPTAVKDGMNKINLSWDSTCNGECWYQIRISQPGAPQIVKDLQATEYVLDLPEKQCTTYTFEVTAHNECGASVFSEATSVKIGDMPNPPVLTSTQANKCGVNLSWDSPLTSCPIQKYIVQMKTGQDKWVAIPACGNDINNRQCTVFMNNLLQMFGLKEGDIVQTRAKALNCCGWSEFSTETGTVAVKTLPSKVSTPERVGSGLGEVTIRWTSTCVGPDCRYVVIITDPTTNQPQIQEVSTKEFIHSNRLPCVQYAYTVTAKNACGTGAHSGPLFVSDGAKPAAPLCLQTRGPSCSVQITWEDVRGEKKCQITGYEVEIQNSSGAWMKLPGCGTDLSKQDCMIKMGKLMKDYELTVGTAVVTRARASNCCGWSGFSVPHSSDIRINQEPQEIEKPECIKVTAKGFTMRWPTAANRSILYCNNGAGTKFVPRYTTSADSTVNVPAIPGVERVTCYLQAVNECGTKQSERKDIVMPKIPDPLVSNQNQVSDCQLEITWSDPQDNGEPVTHFIVEVRSGSGLWAQAEECGNAPTDRKCVIKMTKLGGAPFFLSPKSPITSRVRAVNAVGESLNSSGSNTEVLLAGLPPVMATPSLAYRSASEISICWSRATLEDSQDVEFFWGTSPRTAQSTGASDGLDKKFVQVNKAENCIKIKINANAQQLYRFVVRATNNCGPAPFSPELTVNLCGPNCNHSFQSSEARVSPVFIPNGNELPPAVTEHNEEHLDHHVEHTDGHGPHHQHKDDGVTAVIVQPTPVVSVVTIQEKPVQINNNLPPPILPDNMVQECDSQTGRCWFTTKPAVIPIIQTGGTVTILQPNENEPVPEKETSTGTGGWSSGPTEDVPPMEKIIKPVVKPTPTPAVVKPTRQITLPPATGGWTSDSTPVVVAPTPAPVVRPTPTPQPVRPSTNTNAPATGGWSSGTALPISRPKKPISRTQKPKKTKKNQPQPSTAGSSSNIHVNRPTQRITRPTKPVTPVSVKPTKRIATVPATGGWTSGGSSPANVPKPAPSVQPIAVKPTPIPATRVNPNKETFTGAWSSDNHHQDGEALLAGADSVEEDEEVDPNCPAPPTPDAINCKLEESVAALDWYPEDQYGSALLQSESGVTFQLLQSMPGTDEFIPMYEGPTPQYTISVQEGNLVKFKIRSKRDCGTTSPWQEVSCGDKPEETQEPEVESVIAKAVLSEDLAGCGVKIAWTEPKDMSLGDVQEYKVEINTASGFQVLEGCGKRGILTHCSVSSIKLMKEPFNMQPNDVMEVRVFAHTTNGWTEPSPIAKMQMSASNFPAKMKKAKLISNNSSTITLTWGKLFGDDEGSSKINSYKLEWTDGVNAPFTRIVESTQQVYTISGISAGRTYNIKISAMNSCGFGEFSDSLEVTAAGCPTKMPAPTVAIKGKDVVVISWEASETEAHFPLREYQVLFKSKDGSYMEHKTLCDGSKPEIMERRTCMLAMWEVPKFTGLNPGDLIQVKVRASNRNCHGDFSQPNTEGQDVNKCPAKMEPVTSEKKDISKESITVGWNLKAHQFEIRWQECDETVWTRKNSARTNAQSYKHSGLVNASCQRYIVRAYNSNCRGEWSEGATFTSGEPPAPLGAPIVSVVQDDEQSHSILVTWPEPPAEDKVTGYAVFVGTSSGEYKEDKKLCNGQSKEVIETRECHIPMSTFWEGNYRKDQGTFIGVRVQASNIKGDSDLSPWNIKGPRVEKVPFQMNRPTATKSMTEAAIILEWEEQRNPLDGGSPIVSYNLQFKQRGVENEKWQDVVGFKDGYLETSFIHTDLPVDEKLHYRIRAQNRWGWGQYSTPDLVIDTPKAPAKITKIQSTVTAKTGDIKLTWEAPDSNGSEIQDYKVEIQNNDLEWTEQCSGDKLKCKVRMSELRNKFKLQLGQLVNYRIRAINLAGPSPWSSTNSVGATIRTEPGTMPKLTRGQNTSETQIHVTWEKLTTDKQTGDSEILGYVLQEDGREIYSGMDSEATFDAEDGRIYKLRIAAWNIYGLGEFSEELRIRAGIMPAEISSVRATSVNDSRIKIDWDLKGKNKVIAYEVKIYSKVKGAFETVSNLCDGSNPEIIAETACTIDADVLARNYGYSLGDLFVAKVRAQNSRGWGEWSRRSGATVFRYDAEADLP